MKCENQACPYRGSLRNFLRTRPEGVQLQGRWYCSLDCFEQAVTQILHDLVRPAPARMERRHRIPLGLVLLGKGIISEEQLKRALQAQKEAGAGAEKIGQWLLRLGSASHRDVALALATQWGCPVFPLDQDRRFRECSAMLPLALLESLRMLPVHYLQQSPALCGLLQRN